MSIFNLTPLFNATLQTLYMVFLASFISIFFGLILGSLLFITSKKVNFFNQFIYKILSFIVNVTRSLPFIILMISIIPFTRIVIGTTIGTNAAVVPLAIAAIPFFARIAESALADVPAGLIEAATAMGASTWQIVSKILLPESLSTLVRGATLTIIALIGYSAMAGVVGGGGLGELAINYGYQRFDAIVMLETVIILIVLVQIIQMLGDRLARRPHVRLLVIVSSLLALFLIGIQLLYSPVTATKTIRVGVMSGWPQEVMSVARQLAKEQYQINLEIVPFSDYVQPNTALSNHSIDANIFQHLPYLDAQNKAHHYQLVAIGKTFVYPMGFYSLKIKNLAELANDALIAIPNDPSNEARALLLLQKAGLIALKKGKDFLATVNDITANPHHFQFKLLDSAQLPRVLKDADLVAITNDFIGPTHLTIQNAVLKEGADSLYANIIVVRAADKNNPSLQQLVKVMHSQPVLKRTEEIFPHGAAIPAW